MALKKMTLVINGTERMFMCEPEKDSLAQVIRRLGLTGTKIGCGTGQCGACSVILNGEVCRSCSKKMKTVAEYSVITTIEGLGTAENLHPLQKAWIIYGGVQCGFCSPGFIVSAKCLLDHNPNPTRQEVRDWFQKNRNACRCTGYKPLVDAVMAAAEVMRGDKPMSSLEYKMPEDGKIYSSHFPRPAALGKVLGATDYGDDISQKTPGMLESAVVLARVHHANIISIDISEAEKAPGVVKVVTSKDVKGMNRVPIPIASPRAKGSGFERPIYNDKKVFRYGDILALVIADTRENARAAAKLVKLELEELPANLTAVEALAEDAVRVHDEYPPVVCDMPCFHGDDPREELKKSKFVVEGSFHSSREPHLPIEPDVVQAYIDENGILTIHNKTLALHLSWAVIGPGVGFPKEKIRIIENPTGASFGYSMDPHTSAVVAVGTIAVDGRPVNLTLTYEEHMHVTGKRLPSYTNAIMGCDENGKLNTMAYEIIMEKGAYSQLAYVYAEAGLRFFGAPYTVPNTWGICEVVMTNHNFGIAYRGAGSPQGQHASEILVDMLAEKAGIDPLEFRYMNVYKEGDTSHIGHKFNVYPMQAILDKLRPKYQAAKERAAKESTPEKKRGVGVCCGTFNVGPNPNDNCTITLELNEKDGITLYSNWQDQGQGADIGSLTNCHEAFKELGIRPDQIKLVMNDTFLPSVHGPSGGSRSHYMDGMAMVNAANKLMDAMRKDDGTFRTYQEMKAEGIETKYAGAGSTGAFTSPLDPNTGQGNPSGEYMFAAYLADVEVEVATGKTKVISMHCVCDVGVIGNYLAVDGQAYGGMSHCIGFALSENYHDVDKHKHLIGAGLPFINDVPDGDDFTVEYNISPRNTNPFGSGGCSEVFQSSDHVAILNGIYNAVGVRITDIPALPEKVKAGIDALAAGKEVENLKYNLGKDLFEKLDFAKANPVEIKKA